MRYEDMVLQPQETFTAAMQFVGPPDDPGRIHKAIAFASFDRLQAQECEHGFKEKPRSAVPFFRQGTIGAWRDVLTDDQVNRIIHDHGDVMRRFGYLTEAGEIVF